MAQRKCSNWLKTWCELFEQTNIPEQYVVWSGLFAIAAAMETRTYFDRGVKIVYPNLYIWIVGQAATGKSIAAEHASEMLRLLPGAYVHSGELTKRFMLTAMEASVLHKQLGTMGQKKAKQITEVANPSVIIFHDELAAGIGSDLLAMDMLKTLVQMYPIPKHYDYGTDKHGHIAIQNPCINWIACTTVPWLARAIPPDVIDSGLVARVNTITAPFPSDPDCDIIFDKQKWNNLLHDLLEIHELAGEFKLNQLAIDLRTTQTRKDFEKRKLIIDDSIQALWGREPDQTLKIAMCLSAATRGDLLITETMMESAHEMVVNARETSVDLYATSQAKGSVQLKMLVAQKIKTSLGGIISRARLTSAMSKKCNADGLDMALASLIQEGVVVEYHNPKDRTKAYYWKETIERSIDGTDPEVGGNEAEGNSEAV